MTSFAKPFLSGDTIIEVLFSLAAFGFVAMVTMTLMQQGSASAQLALEISLARNNMNAQAEAIRFINATVQARERGEEVGKNDHYANLWSQLISELGVANWDDVISSNNGRLSCANIPSNAFVLNIKDLAASDAVQRGVIDPARVFPRLVYSGGISTDNNKIDTVAANFERAEGLWVQVESAGSNETTQSYDFHIRSCWETPGKSTPIKLGTVVRVHVTKK